MSGRQSEKRNIHPRIDTLYETLILILFILFATTQLKNEFTNPDGVGYYTHLRSVVFDRDMLYLNEYERFRLTPYFMYLEPSPTGRIQDVWSAGCSFLWAPFLVAARGIGALTHTLHIDTGTSDAIAAEALVIAFATALYGLLAIFLCYRMLRWSFRPFTSFLATAGIWLGTPLFHYQFYEATMAHTCSAFTTTCFVYLWRRDRAARDIVGWALLGAVVGLMVMVRPETSVLVLLPLIDTFCNTRRVTIKQNVAGLLIFGAAAFVCFSPQTIILSFFNGTPFRSGDAQYNMLWLNPHIKEVLFSAYHGLFSWSPIVAVAVTGWLLDIRRDIKATIGYILVFAALTYIDGCMVWWWGGASFGARLFVGLTPIFAVGLATVIEKLPKPVSAAVISACLIWPFLLLMQTLAGKIWLLRFYPFDILLCNSIEILSNLSEYSVLLINPKLNGIPATAAAIGMSVSTLFLYLIIHRVLPIIKPKYGVVGLVLTIIIVDCFLVASWINSVEKEKNNPAPVWPVVYTFDELHEIFPIEYAIYYERDGRPEDGLRELKRLGKLIPNNPGVPVAEAGIYIKLGKHKEARDKAVQAMSLNVRHEMTKQLLNRILHDLSRK